MKAYLIEKIEEKEVVTVEYEKRLQFELLYFEPHLTLLARYWNLKKQGHLLYPEMSTACSSLVLHLLGLNPMDPLLFDLPFLLETDNIETDLCFYCNDLAIDSASGLSLRPLRLLSDLHVVCDYLNVDLDTITQKVVQESYIHDFIEDLIDNIDLRSRSYFLHQTTIDYFHKLEECRATTFEELVKYAYNTHIQIYPNTERKKHLIGEVYMDVLLVGWIWRLGRLKTRKMI